MGGRGGEEAVWAGWLQARLDLPSGLRAVRTARESVRVVLTGWGYREPQWLYQAELVITELVANAVQHAGGCTAVEIGARDGIVTLAALDTAPGTPAIRRLDDSGGRGLLIIEAVSMAWGSDPHHSGKRVWVRLAAPDPTRGGSGRARGT